jgi:hypothetical protein
MLVITAKADPVPRVARPTLILANAAAAVRLVVVAVGSDKVDGVPIGADRLLVAGGWWLGHGQQRRHLGGVLLAT